MALLDLIPEFLQEYREYQYILQDADQPELDNIDARMDALYNNLFVQTADEDGITRYEKMLGIHPQPSSTLDDRRFYILSVINLELPYTERILEKMLTGLCGADGYTLTMDIGNYAVEVKVALKARNMRDAVADMLERILPANLVYDVRIMYNQWKKYSKVWTCDQMKEYTCKQLREEVVNI